MKDCKSKEPKYFHCYLDNETVLKHLTDAQAGALWKLLFAYANRGERPEIGDPMVAMAFDVMVQQMDREFEKYRGKCEKNRENGKKGGAPIGNSNAKRTGDAPAECEADTEADTDTEAENIGVDESSKNKRTVEITTETPKNKRTVEKTTETSQDKEEDKDKDKEENKDKYDDEYEYKDEDDESSACADCGSLSAGADARSAASSFVQGGALSDTQGDCNYSSVIDCFNSVCEALPKVKLLTDSRKKAIRRAKGMLGGLSFEEYFKRAEHSDFLTGRKGGWSGCGFDWLLNPPNLTKVIEGNYDNRSEEKPGKRRASYSIEDIEKIDEFK